jgi:phenylalanyl-tRNA synthetase beta chain
MVKMINSLSAELNILRPSLFETAMDVVARNCNYKNNNLRLFEFGKAYSKQGPGKYNETEQLCLVMTGNKQDDGWKQKSIPADFFYLKSVLEKIFRLLGIDEGRPAPVEVGKLYNHLVYYSNGLPLAGIGEVKKNVLEQFGIRQPVFFAGLNWQLIAGLAGKSAAKIKELPKYPAVQRDLAMVVGKELAWDKVDTTVQKLKLEKLREVKLFDIFESEKLGKDKKSMAVNFTFLDEEKTLTDKEIDGWMGTIMSSLEKELQAEIRK